MAAINTKALILSLIKDDLTHNRLMYGLYKLGLDTDEYTLGLCDTIFMLMHIEPTDANYDFYVHLTEGVSLITSPHHKSELEQLALAIYVGLKERV